VRSPAVKVLVDTGPMVAAIDRRDPAHDAAAQLMAKLGRRAVVPTPVLAEVDHLVRSRVGSYAARSFFQAAAGGTHEIGYLSAGVVRRAAELDDQYADLNLGFVDTCVMAIAERHEFPILTFDFVDFRATQSASGPWPLLIGEDAFRSAIGQ